MSDVIIDENEQAAPKADSSELEALNAEIAERDAELEKLRGLLKERNHEAAEKRVRAREAENTAKTLEEQVAALQARLDAADAESALNRAIAAHGLSPEHAPLLGSDPAKFDELAEQVKNLLAPAAPSDEPAPVGVERLKGGLNPVNEIDSFDPQAIIARHRSQR